MSTTMNECEAFHGTLGGKVNHCCDCPLCTDAWNSYARDRRAFIKAHGTLVPGWRQLLSRKDDV